MAKGIVFFSKLSSLIANATFFIKNADFDEIISRVVLKNVAEVDSGPQIDNLQKEVNFNSIKIFSFLSLVNNSQITLNTFSKNQVIRVSGDTMAIELDPLPFGNAVAPPNGTILYVTGYDDAKTVRINENDVNFGVKMIGDIILKKGETIIYMYDSTLKRYLELSRSK